MADPAIGVVQKAFFRSFQSQSKSMFEVDVLKEIIRTFRPTTVLIDATASNSRVVDAKLTLLIEIVRLFVSFIE